MPRQFSSSPLNSIQLSWPHFSSCAFRLFGRNPYFLTRCPLAKASLGYPQYQRLEIDISIPKWNAGRIVHEDNLRYIGSGSSTKTINNMLSQKQILLFFFSTPPLPLALPPCPGHGKPTVRFNRTIRHGVNITQLPPFDPEKMTIRRISNTPKFQQ